MRQKSKAKGKRILGVVLALVFLISCIMTPDVHAQAESMIIALSARSVKIGDTLAVTVTLPAGVTGTVNLTYSKDLFTYQSATAETSVNAGTVSMTLGSYGSGNKRASGTVKFKADAAGTASFAASAPSAGNQEGDRVDVGGASVSVAVENSAAAADDKSKDNTLASLTISEGTLSPEFQSKVTEYQAKVGDQVTSLAVSAQPNDAKASVISVSGADKLKTGVNKVQIVVQAENGVKKTYTIQVTRGAAQQESQDTQQKGETQAPADGQQYFTIDGTNLYLTDSIPDRYVLDGFVKAIASSRPVCTLNFPLPPDLQRVERMYSPSAKSKYLYTIRVLLVATTICRPSSSAIKGMLFFMTPLPMWGINPLYRLQQMDAG